MPKLGRIFFIDTFPGLADKHDLMHAWFANAMMAMYDHLLLKQQKQQAKPVEYQFFDPETGKWHNFMNDQHRRNTADAGYEIRALYTAPQAQPSPTNKEHDNAKSDR